MTPSTIDAALEAPPRTAAAVSPPKLVHLQILRALAASLVVVSHTFGTLTYRGFSYRDYRGSGVYTGSLGVCAFFVLSGLIMVRQSGDKFGNSRSPFLFIYHRILRIVPLYWIATLAWFNGFGFRHMHLVHPWAQMLFSLFFIPNYFSTELRMDPILGQGWTLNYEMSFYLLFAIALFFPRKFGITILLLVPPIAIGIGLLHHVAASHTPASILLFYTDGIIILFAIGVLIGILELRFKRLPKFDIPISPAFLLVVPAVWFLSSSTGSHALGTWQVAIYLYSIVVVALCTLVVNARLGWFNRALALLGDASYSTYLFHMWVYAWIIPLVFRAYARLHHPVHSVLAFVIAAVIAANLLGLLIHLAIERPMTKALRRLPPTFLYPRPAIPNEGGVPVTP